MGSGINLLPGRCSGAVLANGQDAAAGLCWPMARMLRVQVNVPHIVPELSSGQVLCSQFAEGVPIDKVPLPSACLHGIGFRVLPRWLTQHMMHSAHLSPGTAACSDCRGRFLHAHQLVPCANSASPTPDTGVSCSEGGLPSIPAGAEDVGSSRTHAKLQPQWQSDMHQHAGPSCRAFAHLLPAVESLSVLVN